MIARFLGPSWQLLAVMGVALPVLSGVVAGWKAYGWGVDAEQARWVLATREAQREHDDEIATKQAEIDRITREHSQAEFELAIRLSALQQQLLEQPDEDFVCPSDQPVFSERLRGQLDAIGRD